MRKSQVYVCGKIGEQGYLKTKQFWDVKISPQWQIISELVVFYINEILVPKENSGVVQQNYRQHNLYDDIQ